MSSLKHELHKRLKNRHKYTILQVQYYTKVRGMMRKYYNSKTRHRFRRIVRFIATHRSKRELKKKFRSFLKHVKNSFASLQSSMKFGGGFWNTQRRSMKLPLVRTFYRHNYDRQRQKTTSDRGMKNTLPQYIDYALSTDYIDKHRVNMKELMDLRNMLKLHPVLSHENYDKFKSRVMNLLTDDDVVMRRLQDEFNRIRERDEWKKQSGLGFKVKRFFTR